MANNKGIRLRMGGRASFTRFTPVKSKFKTATGKVRQHTIRKGANDPAISKHMQESPQLLDLRKRLLDLEARCKNEIAKNL